MKKIAYNTAELSKELKIPIYTLRRRLKASGIKPKTIQIGNLNRYQWTAEDLKSFKRWLSDNPARPKGRPKRRRNHVVEKHIIE